MFWRYKRILSNIWSVPRKCIWSRGRFVDTECQKKRNHRKVNLPRLTPSLRCALSLFLARFTASCLFSRWGRMVFMELFILLIFSLRFLIAAGFFSRFSLSFACICILRMFAASFFVLLRFSSALDRHGSSFSDLVLFFHFFEVCRRGFPNPRS